MSNTLFWYIFKDLMKIFMLTSGVLAGIMSFGGLLRPLTEHGLDAGQAVQMLSYFMPAMSTYSLPVAALFATTMVYGRLAADNELTACRAAGISFFSIGTPAYLLGLIVAIVSILLLCFIVPVFTLKVERVVYSNLAQLIANQIDRTHQFKFGEDTTVYAQEAVVSPANPERPRDQIVTLGGLMIVSYEKPETPLPGMDPKTRLPHDFYFARSATAVISPSRGSDDEFTLEATLSDGTVFPRSFANASQGGLSSAKYGPIALESPIRENTKFWDIRRLKAVFRDRAQSREVHKFLMRLVRADQSTSFLNEVSSALTAGQNFLFDAGAETFELTATRGEARLRRGRLELPAGGRLTRWRNGQVELQADAADIEMFVDALPDSRFSVQVALHNASVKAGDEAPAGRKSFPQPFTMNMPANIAAFEQRGATYYEKVDGVPKDQQALLRRQVLKLGNGILSEIHSRVSFALSCLLLVITGFALGTMFRSGNFLSAFAVSVLPALLCIALIVAGQHTCENIPFKLEGFKNPLAFGLALIWSGNAIVAVLAAALVLRLQRQ